MRCEGTTQGGGACGRAAMRGGRRCASHAGRCGARPGNRNAMRHGLYSRALSAEERRSLAAAYQVEGVDEEIAVTRLMIARALRQPEVPLGAYARLVHALCRQLRLQEQRASERGNRLDGDIGAWLDAVTSELGLGEEAGERGDRPGAERMPAPGGRPRRARSSARPAPRRERLAQRAEGTRRSVRGGRGGHSRGRVQRAGGASRARLVDVMAPADPPPAGAGGKAGARQQTRIRLRGHGDLSSQRDPGQRKRFGRGRKRRDRRRYK
jgi:hypothetical protein